MTAYKLDLKGPAISVQTFCSTSLTAVHLACQSLLEYDCDIALAGAAAIQIPQTTGYLYQEGGILAPDGECRAFDANTKGTVFGNGLAIVVLKRLEEALEDGDHIYAIIRGSAMSNDGIARVGFTAPGVNGQASVISMALTNARVNAETIHYIETHGTGTSLGDSVELRAMSKAFQQNTSKTNFCAIGSVKPNIGHLDRASGVTGLIKASLALHHKMLPPSVNFAEPNPDIDWENSPFYVNTELNKWEPNGHGVRRAGVSSFGFGGTNVHTILEEAPLLDASSHSRPYQLLLLSARTESALETATHNLVSHLRNNPFLNLADVAHTLQVGRAGFNHRRMLVCHDLEDGIEAFTANSPGRVFSKHQTHRDRPVGFMFTGQGSQYVDMARDLYETEPVFQEQIDNCLALLKPHVDFDLKMILYPDESDTELSTQKLSRTNITQPALFVIEYALARLWMAWGVQPQTMIGHSIGEYVAACLAGVFSLADGLALVAARGRLMQSLPKGAMLAVPLSEQEIKDFLNPLLSVATINGPTRCVISGPVEAVDALARTLAAKEIPCRHLHTSHAFHSAMMEPILEPFIEVIDGMQLNPPQIPYVSNVTGTWITAEQATDPGYWADHLRHPVRFAEGIATLLDDPNQVLLEVGPGRMLSTLTRQHPQKDGQQIILTSLRHPKEEQSDSSFLLNTLGKLWLAGVTIDWAGFYAHEKRHRLSLPTYPFEAQRYWVEPGDMNGNGTLSVTGIESALAKKEDIGDWFYQPTWKQTRSWKPSEAQAVAADEGIWLMFVDQQGCGSSIAEQLEKAGVTLIRVQAGTQFAELGENCYSLNPHELNDYVRFV